MSNDDAKRAGSRNEQGQAAKAMTIAEIKAKKRPNTVFVTIQLDGELASEISRLKDAYSVAVDFDKRHNVPDTAPKILAQIEELIEQSRDTEVTFVFKAMGRVAYDALVSDPMHSPTPEQAKEGAQFNADTFPAALVSSSCIDPEMTYEDALEIFEDSSWNGAELQKLFFGALTVNTELSEIPLFKGATGATANSVLSLITAANKESLTPSS